MNINPKAVYAATKYLCSTYEVDVDVGMKMHITTPEAFATRGLSRVEMDMRPFVAENRSKMKANYYAEGVPCLTYEQKYSKPLLSDAIYLRDEELDTEFKKCFTLVSEGV